MKKKIAILISSLFIITLACMHSYADFNRQSGFKQGGGLNVGAEQIIGDASSGIYFDTNADGTTDITFSTLNVVTGATINLTSSTITNLYSTYLTVTSTSVFSGAMNTAAITSSGLIKASSGSFSGTVYSTGTITSGGALAGTTLDTGQGANELYDMDQNVLTTDSPTFAGQTITYGIGMATANVTGLLTASSVSVSGTVYSTGTITSGGAIAGTTLDTGQGANELYDMDQNVLTTDSPTFAGQTITYGIGMATANVTGLLTASSVSVSGTVYSTGTITSGGALAGTTLDTGQGANELYDMDQNVLTTSAVTFTTLDTGQGANELYDMDQNVLTTSAVTFSSMTLSVTGTGYGLTVSTGALFATSGGNVGIGTTAPATRLSVYPDTDNAATIGRSIIGTVGDYSDYAWFSHVDRYSLGNYALLQSSNGETFLNASTGQLINFRENNVTKMTIMSDNVGIGTTSPTEKLEVSNGNIKTTYGVSAATVSISSLATIASGSFSGTVYATGTITSGGAIAGTTLDTGQGANELYDMDQNVLQASAVTFATLDTGQGANELYDMDQNVLTTSAVTFTTLDTGQGANELYDMDQNVLTTSAVTFSSMTLSVTGTGYGLTVSTGALFATSGGNVGIGTTNPEAKLDVYGDTMRAKVVNATATIQLNGADINTAGTLTNIAYENQANTFTSNQTIVGATADNNTNKSVLTITANINDDAGDWTKGLTFVDNHAPGIGNYDVGAAIWSNKKAGGKGELIIGTRLNSTTTVAEKIKIDCNGYVGIGSTTPGAALDVNGNIIGITLNTGQGANELYDMDQNVQTTDSPTFAGQTITYGVSAATGVFSGVITSTGSVNYGKLVTSYVTASDTTTVTASSATIVECTGVAMEVILPTAIGNTGLTYTIKKTSTAGVITITTNGVETIDGSDGYTAIDAQYDFATIVSNGANWIITSKYIAP